MENMPWINQFHKTSNREWFETDAVLRVSLGNFLFFTILSLLMIGVKNQKDPRDGLHHRGWMMKIICWFILVILMFFVPNEIISFYEMISKFSSGLFLLVQVLLLDFVHGWNDKWVGYDEQFWYIALFVVSLVCYLATFYFLGLLFHWFTLSGSLVVFINNYVLVVSIATHRVLVSSIRTFSVEFSDCNPFCFWFPLISGTKETPSISISSNPFCF